MTQVSAYIRFGGNCREGMTFYKECLGGELMLQTIEGSPIEAQCPPEMRKQVLHSSLSKGAMLIMGSDMVRPDRFTKSNMIALALNCCSEEEIQTCFDRLSSGGEIDHPLITERWGSTFGELTDKFGIRWMLNYDKSQNQK